MNKSRIQWVIALSAVVFFLTSLTSCERHTCPTYSQAKVEVSKRA
ncbi:MAG: hypothetical protein U0T84_00800 [Chitinophagales bacterium]